MDDLTIDYSTAHRPPVVEDNVGNGWSAVDHGPLTSKERSLLERGHGAQADYTVRLQRRSGSMTDNPRLQPEGARALAAQLIAAADAVDARRSADDANNVVDLPGPTPDHVYFEDRDTGVVFPVVAPVEPQDYREANQTVPVRDQALDQTGRSGWSSDPLNEDEREAAWAVKLRVPDTKDARENPHGNALIREETARRKDLSWEQQGSLPEVGWRDLARTQDALTVDHVDTSPEV